MLGVVNALPTWEESFSGCESEAASQPCSQPDLLGTLSLLLYIILMSSQVKTRTFKWSRNWSSLRPQTLNFLPLYCRRLFFTEPNFASLDPFNFIILFYFLRLPISLPYLNPVSREVNNTLTGILEIIFSIFYPASMQSTYSVYYFLLPN